MCAFWVPVWCRIAPQVQGQLAPFVTQPTPTVRLAQVRGVIGELSPDQWGRLVSDNRGLLGPRAPGTSAGIALEGRNGRRF